MKETEYYIDATRPPIKGDQGVLHPMDRYYNRKQYFDGFGEVTPYAPEAKIQFNKKLENRPFIVEVDSDKLAELLSFAGMSDERINNSTLSLETSGLGSGETDISKQKITLYVSYHWGLKNKNLEKNYKKLQNSKIKKIKSEFLSIDPEPLQNLRQTSLENQRNVIEELSLEGINKELNLVLLHEAEHLTSSPNKLKHFSTYVGRAAALCCSYYINKPLLETGMTPEVAMGFGLGVLEYQIFSRIMVLMAYLTLYKIDPVEVRANKFAKTMFKDPYWQNIISLKPQDEI